MHRSRFKIKKKNIPKVSLNSIRTIIIKLTNLSIHFNFNLIQSHFNFQLTTIKYSQILILMHNSPVTFFFGGMMVCTVSEIFVFCPIIFYTIHDERYNNYYVYV